MSDHAADSCKAMPPWMKTQIGTLQCDHSRKFFNRHFDLCIVQAKVDCGPVSSGLQKWKIPESAVSILQVDVEGYEAVLLREYLKATPKASHPPVIHFKHKVSFILSIIIQYTFFMSIYHFILH